MWGLRIDGRGYTDMVNHHLFILSSYGLVGVLPFLGSILGCVVSIYKNLFRVSREISWMLWTLGATLLGLLFAIFSVSLFGQAFTFMYILFGVCVSAGLYCKESVPVKRLKEKPVHEKSKPKTQSYRRGVECLWFLC